MIKGGGYVGACTRQRPPTAQRYERKIIVDQGGCVPWHPRIRENTTGNALLITNGVLFLQKGLWSLIRLMSFQKHVSQPASLLHGNSYLQVVQKVLKCDVTLLSNNNSDWSQKGIFFFFFFFFFWGGF